MSKIDLLMPCFLIDCVVGLGRVESLKLHFFIKVIVKLYVISNDGRQAAVAELRRADKLEDEVKKGVTSFRGGFKKRVPI